MELVTIYILTYKKFENIFDTIASALAQDYDRIELIVSDDGSPNFPAKEIEEYIRSHKCDNIESYQVRDNKVNVGTVKHINSIVKTAKGDILIPLAGDDCFFDATVISRVVERYHISSFKVLTTSRALHTEGGKFLNLMPHYISRRIIERKMKTAVQQHKLFTECKAYDFASGSAMAYESEFLRQMGYFDEKYRLWEDGPFIAKMTANGTALTLAYDIISIKYRCGGVSSGENPILRKDVQLFNSSDRREKEIQYGFFHRRILKYTEIKYQSHTFLKRVLHKVLFFDVLFDQLIYQIKEKHNAEKDIIFIHRFK